MRMLLLAVVLMLGDISVAYAHAHVESSTPADGQVLESSPEAIKITFSEALRLNESLVSVYDEHKKPIDGRIIIKPGEGDVISYLLPELSPGRYTVKWKAVCLCTDHHATRGTFAFSVKE